MGTSVMLEGNWSEIWTFVLELMENILKHAIPPSSFSLNKCNKKNKINCTTPPLESCSNTMLVVMLMDCVDPVAAVGPLNHQSP